MKMQFISVWVISLIEIQKVKNKRKIISYFLRCIKYLDNDCDKLGFHLLNIDYEYVLLNLICYMSSDWNDKKLSGFKKTE